MKYEYVWVIYSMNQIGKELSMKRMFAEEQGYSIFNHKKKFQYPVQVRLFAKDQGYSVYDELYVNDNIIVFCKKCKNGDGKSIVALKRKIV